ncbi:M20/M25/M40 family metallo-hydrolase [Brevibacillus humidisoli]|uniref:M20/M25/M40 family metallo-hydrolase n=1 Tax=Brevibacillus humidisoli TaxID=2895522 RepID=UPI001E38C4EE|nr:M20/M25/M40 family metallo-hydrolase [Brevibacillus humidisoli]UFJ41848.1 M20/M25/M40 family metallo-hydrolase [Brevibacillus humidisoli]
MQQYQHWNEPEAIRTLINRLVEVPSISGTAGETLMAEKIVEILREIPYYQKHPELVMSVPVPDDPLNRTTVAALYRGNPVSSKTIVLLSHFDVVGVDDFGYMREYAFQPELLTEKLHQQFRDALDEEARNDLDSGSYLFGRGVMDMKAGLAVQLAVLSEIAQQETFPGNILLLATPDEEKSSKGMFAAVPFLNQLKQQHGLEYQLCICSEPNFAAFPGDRSNYIYTGSVGKLLPLILCVGRETHAGEPLEGLNAAWMAAEMVKRMELSEQFVDRVNGEQNPPPTCLKMSDLKTQYDVQTPNLAYILYNVLTLSQTPLDVLHKVKQIAGEAAECVYRERLQKYEMYNKDVPTRSNQVSRPAVYDYSELYQRGIEQFGRPFAESLDGVLQEGRKANWDSQELSVQIAAKMSTFFIEEAPFYLIMFAPPYYPHVHLDQQSAEEQKITEVIEQVRKDAAEQYGEEIQVQHFFTGLSDVSYCRIYNPEQVVPTLQSNMPLWGNQYNIPIDDIIALNLPTINLGPYGKDAHKRSERLELHYTTRVVPHLLRRAIDYVFS